jgi:hypothetical protein
MLRCKDAQYKAASLNLIFKAVSQARLWRPGIDGATISSGLEDMLLPKF